MSPRSRHRLVAILPQLFSHHTSLFLVVRQPFSPGPPTNHNPKTNIDVTHKHIKTNTREKKGVLRKLGLVAKHWQPLSEDSAGFFHPRLLLVIWIFSTYSKFFYAHSWSTRPTIGTIALKKKRCDGAQQRQNAPEYPRKLTPGQKCWLVHTER